MKLCAILAICAGLLAGPALAAEPVEGLWQTRPDDNGNVGHVQIAPCGAALCGTLIRSFGPDGKEIASPNIGRRIVWDMQPEGGGAYAGGKVWTPDRDKTYRSHIQLDGDRLTVKGCVLGGLACRGQDWTRAR